jgi:hypothetical protein
MKFKHLIFPAVVLMLSAGCYQIGYSGKSLDCISGKDQIVLYYSQEQFPADTEPEILGEAVASAGSGWSVRDLQEKLKRFAAEKGANGILIEKIEKIPAGKARADQIKNLSSPSWIVDDNSQNAYSYFREDMLNYSKTEPAEQEVYRLVIRAKLVRIAE